MIARQVSNMIQSRISELQVQSDALEHNIEGDVDRLRYYGLLMAIEELAKLQISVLTGLQGYMHYKDKPYEHIVDATHTETGEVLRVCLALYGESSVWARPVDMFEGSVVHNGVVVPRFEKMPSYDKLLRK